MTSEQANRFKERILWTLDVIPFKYAPNDEVDIDEWSRNLSGELIAKARWVLEQAEKANP